MKLWLIQKAKPGRESDGRWDWDCYYGHVVRAETEGQARLLCPNGAEGSSAWLDAALTTCTELTADGEAGVILSDFLAG